MFGKKKPEKQLKQQKPEKQPKQQKSKKTVKKQEPIPGIMGMGDDYHIYHMSVMDRLKAAGIGIALGVAVGYVFFENLVMAAVLSVILVIVAQKPFEEFCKKQRQRRLLLQFKDLLEALTASYSAGQTTTSAFADALEEMSNLYGENADIVAEVQMVNVGLQHNYNIEDLLLNFAQRSGLDDVDSFANVFEVCNRKGGNLKQVVAESRGMINDKIEVEMEIQTMIAGSQNELNVMMCMPLVIMIAMKGLGTTSSGMAGIYNFIAKLVALGIFGTAYVIGRKIVDIKV